VFAHRAVDAIGRGKDEPEENGVLRDAASLARAATQLELMADAADLEVRNLVAVSSALVDAARARTESRGTHTRLDFPERSSELLGRFVFGPGGSPSFVPLPEAERVR
jgi:L-aspartate oxidase